jgi:hypothetical protein
MGKRDLKIELSAEAIGNAVIERPTQLAVREGRLRRRPWTQKQTRTEYRVLVKVLGVSARDRGGATASGKHGPDSLGEIEVVQRESRLQSGSGILKQCT